MILIFNIYALIVSVKFDLAIYQIKNEPSINISHNFDINLSVIVNYVDIFINRMDLYCNTFTPISIVILISYIVNSIKLEEEYFTYSIDILMLIIFSSVSFHHLKFVLKNIGIELSNTMTSSARLYRSL